MASRVPYTVPNLIQGVSQQEPQQRRDTQCEAQFDCINSPKSGAVARAGFDVRTVLEGEDFEGALFHEVRRGDDEHYLMVLKAGVLKIYNLATGLPCTVTDHADYVDYLENASGRPDRDNFRVQTVDDFTFIVNRSVKPEMAGTLSSVRDKEALVFCKSGNYDTTYTIAIAHDGVVYKWSYKTPASGSTRQIYIATNFIASVFYRIMTGNDPSAAPAQNLYGVGSVLDGDPSATYPSSSTSGPGSTAAALGFGVAINGNLLRIWRTDGDEFTIDTADGLGNTELLAFKDTARSFTELPKDGFDGFVLRISGVQSSGLVDDFFVEYVADTAAGGAWKERVAPGVPTSLDRFTMPHAIVNTAPDTFEVRPLVWSDRIAGDGEETAKDPGFVGKWPQDIFYHQKRFAILTESTCDWSKARNVYTHFPDTVQAALDDAPIGLTLTGTKKAAQFRAAVQVDESLYLWAQEAQLRIHSGQETFKANSVEAPPSTAYEFSEKANFATIGTILYWATEPGEYAQLRALPFQQGRAGADFDITEHVSEYIPEGVTALAPSDTAQMIAVASAGEPSHLYLYNFRVNAEKRFDQAAWNTWRLPEGTLLWHSFNGTDLNAAIQRAGDVVILCRCPMSLAARDAGYEADLEAYLTRLDLRVSEAECVSVSYNSGTNRTTFTLPYALTEAEEALVRVVARNGNGGILRGTIVPVVSASGATVVVAGDRTGQDFYIGLRISSERTESPFFRRDDKGVILTDSLTIHSFLVSHSKTAAYRVEADIGAGRVRVAELKPWPLGVSTDVLGEAPRLDKGKVRLTVDAEHLACTIRIVNDTPYPSRWQNAKYEYSYVHRAKGA